MNSIRSYFEDTEFRYTVFVNKLHIINYTKLLSLEDERVSILYKNKRIIFKGKEFILNKLLDDEVIINGMVLGVEVNEV